MKKGYLVFSDGSVFEGEKIGADGESIGELVFTTGMEGYLETLTDPSFSGQIVVQTFPQIGNYGVISGDFEGKTAVKGYIVSELCENPSNFRSEYALDKFLKDNGICGLQGIDTRAITRKIREMGVLNAGIFDEIPKDLSEIKNYAIKGAVKAVSTIEKRTFYPAGKVKLRVALIDYGAKKNIINSLLSRGAEVAVFPYNIKAEEIFDYSPDGVMLSNGPGDPQENAESIAELKKIIGKIPTFGICLGHQLAALAMGGETYKLKYGHRGANQPVKSLIDGRTYITSQNHGYAVKADSVKAVAEEIFTNANDLSCEGLSYNGKRCFTVQFHPEAAAGPHDTGFLFDKFFDLMDGKDYAEE